MEFVPNVEAIVGDAACKAAVEEPAQPNILGAGTSKVDVRRAQDARSLRFALFRKRDLEIADSDFPVTTVEAMENQTERDSQFIEKEVGQEADRMERGYQYPEYEA